MNREREVLRLIARAPMRTVRPADLEGVYAYPASQLAILERRGVLRRLAHGFYCAVPAEHVGGAWRPTIEAAAAAVATAVYGEGVPVLTGLTAARVHRALPRAISLGFVAVPSQRRPLPLAGRDGEIRFVRRAVKDLDAIAVTTELGRALATTPAQTVLDLARLDPRGEDPDSQEAIAALWQRSDPATLRAIADRQRMKATYARVAAGR